MGGKRKIRDENHAAGYLGVWEELGGHEVYAGRYKSINGSYKMWTQLGDDGESNGCPAADMIVENGKVSVYTGDPRFDKSWKIPVYGEEMREIVEEMNEILDKYYSQWVEQDRFVKRGK